MLPEKRSEILYVRVTESNKGFVDEMAKRCNISESAYVDHLLEQERMRQGASNKKKARRSS